MKVDYCLVFRNVDGEEFYEYATLYYDRDSHNLIIVCDSDYYHFQSELDDDLIKIRNVRYMLPISEPELPFSEEVE